MVKADRQMLLAHVRRELEYLARVGLSRALSADETARYGLLLGYEQLLLIGITSVESA